MLTTLIKFIVTESIRLSVINIMYHYGINHTNRQQFGCPEFPLADAIVKLYEVIPVYYKFRIERIYYLVLRRPNMVTIMVRFLLHITQKRNSLNN
jgi:hypothetical protein